MCFYPARLGFKTRLESSIRRFSPNFIHDYLCRFPDEGDDEPTGFLDDILKEEARAEAEAGKQAHEEL